MINEIHIFDQSFYNKTSHLERLVQLPDLLLTQHQIPWIETPGEHLSLGLEPHVGGALVYDPPGHAHPGQAVPRLVAEVHPGADGDAGAVGGDVAGMRGT